MSHFAQLSPDNIVLQVAVGDRSTIGLPDSPASLTAEEEAQIIAWFVSVLGGTWVRCWYDAASRAQPEKYRLNFAGVGYTYDRARDAFIPPKPFESWTLDEKTCQWLPPTPHPGDGRYGWDEDSLSWLKAEPLKME